MSRTEFKKGAYIVTLINDGYCGKVNYCSIQRRDYHCLSPCIDTDGNTANDNYIFTADDDSGKKWRYATPEEAAEYERRGKPYDVTELQGKPGSELIVGETYEIFNPSDGTINGSTGLTGARVIYRGVSYGKNVIVDLITEPGYKNWYISPTCLRKPTSQSSTPAKPNDNHLYFFTPRNKEESKVVQRLLFKEGYKWAGSGRTIESYVEPIFFDSRNTLMRIKADMSKAKDLTNDPTMVSKMQDEFLLLAEEKGFADCKKYRTVCGTLREKEYPLKFVRGYDMDCGKDYIYSDGMWGEAIVDDVCSAFSKYIAGVDPCDEIILPDSVKSFINDKGLTLQSLPKLNI